MKVKAFWTERYSQEIEIPDNVTAADIEEYLGEHLDPTSAEAIGFEVISYEAIA